MSRETEASAGIISLNPDGGLLEYFYGQRSAGRNFSSGLPIGFPPQWKLVALSACSEYQIRGLFFKKVVRPSRPPARIIKTPDIFSFFPSLNFPSVES
jgi:hypothetical protein